MKHILRNKNKAFTLSEVLITLVIIGIIAAITVPLLITNSNEKALKAALRKNYSVLTQAVRKYYIDNGSYMDAETDTYKNFILKYFNVSQKSFKREEIEKMKYYNYANIEQPPRYFFAKEYETVLLSDGTLMYPYNVNGSYEIKGILIDVNGPYKKPNRIGKDTFFFHIYYEERTNKKNAYYGDVIPGGSSKTTYHTLCDKTNTSWLNGFGCTDAALKEN